MKNISIKYITYYLDTKKYVHVSRCVKLGLFFSTILQSSGCVSVLQCYKVLGHVTETVEVTAYAAEVTERGQQPVEPQAIAELSIFDICLTQLGVGFTIRREANVLTQSACLLNKVHICHDL